MNTPARSVVAAAAAALLPALIAAPAQARPAWETSPVRVTHNVQPTPRVVDMRVGEHANFDRVVIDLKGKITGYHVRYVKELRYDGSGDPVPLQGRRFIAITLTPAKAHNADGESVYEGPTIGEFGLPVIRGAAFTGDFEGQVSFGLALRRRENFRVFVLHDPQRIVIDVHR